jgi:hypothetical protein
MSVTRLRIDEFTFLLNGEFTVLYSGRGSPAARSNRRKLTSSGRLRCNASTVARPIAVRPMIRVKSLLHSKCSDHRWRRGLNSGTMRPVCGSRACVFVYLRALHQGHAQARLSNVVVPPASRGLMCSQWKAALVRFAGQQQYSHNPLARILTWRRVTTGTCSLGIVFASYP